MADTRETVERVRNFARSFQAVIDLADALEGMASVQQACNEANIELSRLQKQIGMLVTTRDKEQDALTIVRADAAQIRDDVNVWRVAEMANAERDAERVRHDAMQAAASIEAEIEHKMSAAMTQLAGINIDIETRGKELNDIEARIARAKAKMAELLGA